MVREEKSTGLLSEPPDLLRLLYMNPSTPPSAASTCNPNRKPRSSALLQRIGRQNGLCLDALDLGYSPTIENSALMRAGLRGVAEGIRKDASLAKRPGELAFVLKIVGESCRINDDYFVGDYPRVDASIVAVPGEIDTWIMSHGHAAIAVAVAAFGQLLCEFANDVFAGVVSNDLAVAELPRLVDDALSIRTALSAFDVASDAPVVRALEDAILGSAIYALHAQIVHEDRAARAVIEHAIGRAVASLNLPN